MEGLRPPPKASHLFPDNPDLRKFWGTPTGKAFFRVTATFLTIYGSFLGLQLYLTRNEKGPLGMDFTMTDEQAKKRIKLIKSEAKLPTVGEDIFYNKQQELKDPNLRFDDGVGFNRYSTELPFSGRKAVEAGRE